MIYSFIRTLETGFLMFEGLFVKSISSSNFENG